MRIGFLADSHFGKTGLADSRRAHNFIVQDMERRGVDLVLHGGDVFDSADPHPRVVKAASDLFVRLSEKRPVVVVRGNHDSSESMAILNTLPTSHHVTVEAGCWLAQGPHSSRIRVVCSAFRGTNRLTPSRIYPRPKRREL